MRDKFAARSPKEWDDEVLRLETQVAETAKTGIELGRELEQTKKALAQANLELERWRHGKQIESDYICENALELDKMRGAYKQAQDREDEFQKLKRTVERYEEQHKLDEEFFRKELGSSDPTKALRDLKRKLQETEKAGEDIRKKNGDLVDENKRMKERLQIDPGGSDKIDELEEAMDQLRARLPDEKLTEHELGRKEAYLKVGLKNIQLDTLKGIDKVTISADGLDWEGLSHKYYELLSLARRFNMAIVVLP